MTKIRHFMDIGSGRVLSFSESALFAEEYDEGRKGAYAEVQVVPLDAKVMGEDDRQQIDTYWRIINHPFFRDAARVEGSLSDELVRRLDAVTDAIVIRREELPAVDVWFKGEKDQNLRTEYTQVTPSEEPPGLPERLEREARERLAIAAYLREHPPVDEAQVKAVMTELQRAVPYDDDSRFDHAAVARRLVERGVRVDGAS